MRIPCKTHQIDKNSEFQPGKMEKQQEMGEMPSLTRIAIKVVRVSWEDEWGMWKWKRECRRTKVYAKKLNGWEAGSKILEVSLFWGFFGFIAWNPSRFVISGCKFWIQHKIPIQRTYHNLFFEKNLNIHISEDVELIWRP